MKSSDGRVVFSLDGRMESHRSLTPYGRRVPLYNRTLTSDSHNGTDFATPPGTSVVAPAAGRVAVVTSEYNRGGLEVMLDHGDGLCTTSGHLACSLVSVGDEVARGQPIALSGASGLNFPSSMLAEPSHLHFNVWLDGIAVDPFAHLGEVSLWLGGNDPTPNDELFDDGVRDSDFDDAKVAAWIASCVDAALAGRLAAIDDPWLRACETMFAANYYPTRFTRSEHPYRSVHPRLPRLDLPFSAADYDGVVFRD